MTELTVAKALPKLPKNEILIDKNGNVKSISEWKLWNLKPWETLSIVRKPDGSFWGMVSSPNSLAVSERNLEEILRNLHHDFQKKYKELFSLSHPTDEQVHALGFGPQRLKIIRH